MARTNIAVEETLADSLSDEASRKNKTLYALANESLEAFLKVSHEGGNPGEIYSSWRFMRILKDVDSIPLPGNLVEKLLRKLYTLDKNWLLKAWFEEGTRLGTYLKMSAPNMEELGREIDELQGFLPVKRLQLEKKERAGEKPSFTLRAVGVGLSEESTMCSEQLIRGVLSSYSLRVVSSDVSQGMVEIKAVQEAVVPQGR